MSLYAALSLLSLDRRGTLEVALGTPAKHPANPLFVQDRPWETRIDNGYPNVVPTDEGYRMWYGTCTESCDRQFLLFANSTDGIEWTKPSLGLFDLSTAGIEDLANLGTDNNIIVEAGGVGVFFDPHESDPNRRYKAIGPGCWMEATLAQTTTANCLDGDTLKGLGERRFWGQIASSPDGFTWPASAVENVSWPAPQKWDTHTNAFYDSSNGDYLITTRSIPVVGDEAVRTISVTRTTDWDLGYDESDVLPIVLNGTADHQPYAQITFPWHNIYLGLVMVFDADTGDQVHSRLVWSETGGDEWKWVGGNDVTDAPDFIPLSTEDGAFDSHIIFAAASPFRHLETGDEWMYYMGGDGPHDFDRSSALGLATLRQDGFACVRGTGTFITPSIVVTEAMLTATVDFASTGALRVGVLPDGVDPPPSALSLNHSMPLTANSTNAPLRFDGGWDLSSYIDKTVRLEVSLEGGAMLFTLGFTASQ